MSEFLDEIYDEPEEQIPVGDDILADELIERIAKRREEIDMWQKHYEAQFESTKRTIESDIFRMEASLRDYLFQMHDRGLSKTTKTQTSYSLPHGKLVMKKQLPEYNRDDDVLIDWLDKNGPEYIKVTKSVNWAELKKSLKVEGESMVTSDAEIVPGISVVERPDIFKVEVK